MKEKSILIADKKERFIWFEGVITKETAKKFIRLLASLNNQSKSERLPICFYIKGIGGDFNSTIQIAKSIEKSLVPVFTIAHGIVGSGCFLLTQTGQYRLAMAGTRFGFHPGAIKIDKKTEFIEQDDLSEIFDQAKICNAVQLGWFLRKGEPADEICSLFKNGAVLSLSKAIKLGLIDSYYKEEDFYKDRRIARKMLKA